ncbi:serine/threonine-protein kinase tousled-like 1-B [Sycon ciliatum]|uniref:serine/threonine-protein kinase tousled-like 1-B n=1 Tax=Sycon ciliatum TaxID=27933 RepID=UPI0031F62707
MATDNGAQLDQAKAFLSATPDDIRGMVNQLPNVDINRQLLLEGRLRGVQEHFSKLRNEKEQHEQQQEEQQSAASPLPEAESIATPRTPGAVAGACRTPNSGAAESPIVLHDHCADSNLSNISEASLEAIEEDVHKSKGRKRKAAESASTERPSKKISDFFGKSMSPFSSSSASTPPGSSKSSGSCTKAVQTDLAGRDIDGMLVERAEASATESQKDGTIGELKRLLASNRTEMDKRHRQLARLVGLHRDLLREQYDQRRQAARQNAMQNSLRLGHFTMQRGASRYSEIWTEGTAFQELRQRQLEIRQERDELQKKKRPGGRPKKANNASTTSAGDAGFQKPAPPMSVNVYQTEQHQNEQEEIIKLREKQLRKEEQDLLLENEKLERERNLHIRELKRIDGENVSQFSKFPLMSHERYIFLELLGKGGFSEVYKAFDLKEFRYVACKVHQLSREWKEERKANYLKHASRESKIHEKLEHPRIVRLYDSFVIDQSSFCTVLEYCAGNDLDFVLKQNKMIPEREARSIVCQVVSALRYMNSIQPPVIHYDLKPGNILLCSGSATGEIKITDFGLSKIKEGDSGADMELTSQGAGTYWYLPPECFLISRNGPAMISSKVDVWSVGVVFFQCLFGVKPFGNDLTQASILEQNTILNAREVEFPAKPAVSQEAKTFIRRCLTYHKDERPSVMDLAQDAYLQNKTAAPKSTNAAA